VAADLLVDTRCRTLSTAVRQRIAYTGERYKGAHQEVQAHPGKPLIPAADTWEQALLETEFLHRGGELGSASQHPMGIVRIRPYPDRLTVVLDNEPYVIRYWVDRLLPVDSGPADEIRGICGLRYSRTGHHVRLYRQDTATAIDLTGFNPHWWDRAVDAAVVDARAQDATPCFTGATAPWTTAERDLHTALADTICDPHLGSRLLRRIRLTAFEGPYGGTDLWSHPAGRQRYDWILETLRGHDHSKLLALLTDPQTGVGLQLRRRSCYCEQAGMEDEGCTAVLESPDGVQRLLVRDLRWTVDEADLQCRTKYVTDRNRHAFSPWTEREDTRAVR